MNGTDRKIPEDRVLQIILYKYATGYYNYNVLESKNGRKGNAVYAAI